MNTKETKLLKEALDNIQSEIHQVIVNDMNARKRISSDEQWQEQKEKEIEQIMEDIENVQGPLADQEALYERAWEEWEQQNETKNIFGSM